LTDLVVLQSCKKDVSPALPGGTWPVTTPRTGVGRGGTDNRLFSRKVFINGAGLAGVSGGPLVMPQLPQVR
jgi:hypothetical protein